MAYVNAKFRHFIDLKKYYRVTELEVTNRVCPL